jgi:hypothetical protein
MTVRPTVKGPGETAPGAADHQLTLVLLPGAFAVCGLDPNEAVPSWATRGTFVSVTRTPNELSVVCREEDVPEGVRCERGWRCLQVPGPLDFSLVGVLASLLTPLAEAGVSVFALSTFDTDYLLVREADLERAERALRTAGHEVGPG